MSAQKKEVSVTLRRINHAGLEGEDGVVLGRKGRYFVVKLDPPSNEEIFVLAKDYKLASFGFFGKGEPKEYCAKWS